MAKQSLFPIHLLFVVAIAAVLTGGAYLFGIQQSSRSEVLASTSTTLTKAGQVASAAYAKCINNGGFVSTSRRGSGFYNVCNFEDDMSCELYSLYNGQCPIGGVKTVGYSTTPQVFCALRGGQPSGSENGQCKMPDGKICSTDAVYKGTCSPN